MYYTLQVFLMMAEIIAEQPQFQQSSRVLSVQSHVVSGYVGNRAAIFPLQLLGIDVDAVNSLQFSNHTGYPTVKGQSLNENDLREICDGLESNQLLDYDYLLSGYIGTELFLNEISTLWKKILLSNPQARYVCDPVLGDEGVLYVDSRLVEIFRSRIIPLAHVITPNQFEAELLTGIVIESEQSVCEAIRALHSMGPEIVVLTSASYPTDSVNLYCFISVRTAVGKLFITKIVVPKIEGYYTGTGDASAALCTAWLDKLYFRNSDILTCESGNSYGDNAHPVSRAFYLVLATIKSIILKTKEKEITILEKCRKEGIALSQERLARARELQIIGSKGSIEDPPVADLNPVEYKTWTIDC